MPQWTAGGVSLPDGPYMIGAGDCKTPERTAMWLTVAATVSGSYTPPPRSGNSGKVLWPATLEEFLVAGGGLNSYSMPNIGFAQAAVKLAPIKAEQPLIVNVAGFSVADYIEGVEVFSALENVAAIELNLGCPNTAEEERADAQEVPNPNAGDILSFNPIAVREILNQLVEKGFTKKPLWLKFSPYSNPAELKRMAYLVNEFVDRLPLAVVTCNTFPNAYAGEGKIDANDGMAGLSGKAMKRIALGQVRQFRQHLQPSIEVICSGGGTTGNDIMDALEAGAVAMQFTSLAHWAGDPSLFFEHLLDNETASRFIEHITDDI